MAASQVKCGAVAEWSKALAWKVSIRQNRIEGSNPSRSANHVESRFDSVQPCVLERGLTCDGVVVEDTDDEFRPTRLPWPDRRRRDEQPAAVRSLRPSCAEHAFCRQPHTG